ncbi:MAG TPA: thiamine phosphate synthase [Acidimicrobiales bacterium]|nr:thiamine phosphate synthase [Acidimicrobiales bacterium]
MSGALAGRRLYLCTADRPDLERFVGACIEGGVDVVQLRDKDLDAPSQLRRAAVAAAVCAGHGVPFVLNDRPDLTLALREAGGAGEGSPPVAGVHVGQDDAPARLARRILGDDAVIGLSTHCEADLDDGLGQPVDYLSAGPVVPTPTKPGRPGTGLDYVRTAAARCRAAGMPLFVTGGVTPEGVRGLAAAGVDRFVVVRYLTESEDPRAAAARLRRAIDEAVDANGGAP